jgi:hypothetical protein
MRKRPGRTPLHRDAVPDMMKARWATAPYHAEAATGPVALQFGADGRPKSLRSDSGQAPSRPYRAERVCESGDLAGFFEAETRAAGMELGWVAVTEVAEEV